jgi:hypothetical protein
MVSNEELFEYNERAYIGFLNNAIVRGDEKKEYYTLQEYCVKNNRTRKRGRADFLILDTKSKEYYLIEAKQNFTREDTDKKWNESSIKKYLHKIIKQANKYIKADIDFFRGKKVYTCAMVFDSVKLSSSVAEYLEMPYKSSIPNYFYTCFYLENISRVLNVYGMIEQYHSSK